MRPLAVELRNISRHFGDVRAIDNIDLKIQQREFFAMLGPSGSGKTTCLRLIAGFDQPTMGTVAILGQPAQGLPPYRRQVNTVFQDYALFPHLSVAENVAYGLMVKGVDKPTRSSEANNMLEMVQMPEFGNRKPSELSGGQRQRVALARALINKPNVLLLDEPLGALDLQLREQMQEELKHLQRNLGITFVLVTHDQTEAFSMADRVAIFNQGKIVQIGAPKHVYHHPQNKFVADFVGSSNVLSAELVQRITGKQGLASLRPESIRFVSNGGHRVTVVASSFLGAVTRYTLDMDGVQIRALSNLDSKSLGVGDTAQIAWDDNLLHIMDDNGG